jgi:hypothetical protein
VQEKKIEPAPIHRVLEIFFFSSNIYQTKLFIIFNRHLNNTIFSKFSVDTSHMQSHLNCVNTTLLFPPFFLTWYALWHLRLAEAHTLVQDLYIKLNCWKKSTWTMN